MFVEINMNQEFIVDIEYPLEAKPAYINWHILAMEIWLNDNHINYQTKYLMHVMEVATDGSVSFTPDSPERNKFKGSVTKEYVVAGTTFMFENVNNAVYFKLTWADTW